MFLMSSWNHPYDLRHIFLVFSDLYNTIWSIISNWEVNQAGCQHVCEPMPKCLSVYSAADIRPWRWWVSYCCSLAQTPALAGWTHSGPPCVMPHNGPTHYHPHILSYPQIKGGLISQLTQLLMPPITDHFRALFFKRRLLLMLEATYLGWVLQHFWCQHSLLPELENTLLKLMSRSATDQWFFHQVNSDLVHQSESCSLSRSGRWDRGEPIPPKNDYVWYLLC